MLTYHFLNWVHILLTCSCYIGCNYIVLICLESLFTLLVGCQEEQPACKNFSDDSDEVLLWLSVWSELQIVCIWSSWCHCHPKTPSSLALFKSRLVLPFWYWLTQDALERRPLNGCSSSSSSSGCVSSWTIHVCLWCGVVIQNQVHTAVVMASRQPATQVISRPHTQCHSSIRPPQPNQRLDRESIRQEPLHRHQLSRHFLQCRPDMSISSRDQSRWLLNSMLAIFDLTRCQGITHHRQVNTG